MKFFTKSNLISIATLALVCIPSAAVSAANFKPSQTSEYSTLEMVNNQPVARLRPIKIHKSSSNEIEVAQRVKSNHDGDAQNTLDNTETVASSVIRPSEHDPMYRFFNWIFS